jgi:putative ABC transport system substrate-binding protein
MRRRDFISLLGGAAAPAIVWPLAAREQQSTSVARIGYLHAADAFGTASYIEAFRAGLRDLGYVEGKSLLARADETIE